MTIDLLSPFWGGLIVGIMLINVAGILKFAVVATGKKAAEDHISNLISEIYSLNKNYKKEIADIQKRNNKEITQAVQVALDNYNKQIDTLLEHNKPSQNAFYVPKKLKIKGIAEI